MTTNGRTKKRTGKRRLTPEAIAAWQAADFHALHCAFGLQPFEPSPLPSEITAAGCSLDDVPKLESDRLWDQALPKVQALQGELLAVAGWPDCRVAYEENLAEAKSWFAYAGRWSSAELGGVGTGCDPASRLRKLQDARAEVRYRKQLLEGLEEVQQT